MTIERIIPVCLGLWAVALGCAMMPDDRYEDWFFLIAFVGVCVAYALGVCVCFSGGEGMPKLSLSGVILMTLGFMFWAITGVSVLFSDVPYESFIFFCFFSVFPFSFLLFGVIWKYECARQWALYLGVAYFAFLAVGYIYHFVSMDELRARGSVAWLVANPNSLAAIMSFGFFASLGVGITSRRAFFAWVGAVLAGVLLVAIHFTGGLAPLYALLGGFLVFLALDWRNFRRYWQKLVCVCVVFCILTAGVNVLIHEWDVAAPASLVLNEKAIALDKQSVSQRWELWRSAKDIAQDHFWTGTGIGTFFLYYPEYRYGDVKSAGLMVHNDPLQFWSEMGIFAPIVFYAFVLVSLGRMFWVYRRLPMDEPRRYFVLLSFCGLGAMIAHTHFSFNFYVLPMLVLSGAILAVWFWESEKVLAQKSGVFVLSQWFDVRVAVCLPLIVLVSYFCVWQASGIAVTRAKTAMVEKDFETFVDSVNFAGRITGQKNALALVMASSVSMGVLETQGRQLSVEEVRKLYESGIDQLDKAKRYNPRLPAIYYMKGRYAQLSQGILPEVSGVDYEALFVKALKVDPKHLKSRIELAKVYLARGEKQKAFELLKGAYELAYMSRDQIGYWQLLAKVANDVGEHEMQQNAAEKLKAIFRGNMP